jgi:hypothetical protein
MPTHWLRAAAAPGGLYRGGDTPDLSVIDGREQPFRKAVDGLTIDPANQGDEIVHSCCSARERAACNP